MSKHEFTEYCGLCGAKLRQNGTTPYWLDKYGYWFCARRYSCKLHEPREKNAQGKEEGYSP